MFFLLFLTSVMFASLFNIRDPEKPGLYGVRINENGESEFIELKKSHLLRNSDHPVAWDFRLVQGSQTISNVFDQGSCGGCWAFASADVAGASLFLNKGINTILSPQYMIDCHAVVNYGGYTYEQGGCNGGYPIVAFVDIKANGLPTQQCIPWVTYERSNCPSKCTNNAALNKENNKDNFKIVDAYKESLQTLRDLVTTSGPCIAEMYAYDDLSDYKGVNGVFPVYEHNKSLRNYEGHAVTVYGFGTQDGKDYWLIKNSWNKKFGDGGFFKIRMGTNESGIENNFYSLYNNPSDYPETKVPRPITTPGSSPGSDWNDVNECKDQIQSVCNANTKCKWYPGATEPPFCEKANAKCADFDSAHCETAADWGLECVAGKYSCVEYGGSECAERNSSNCQSTKNCRLYSNNGMETCEVLDVKCSWFDSDSTECEGASAAYELRCVYDPSQTPTCFSLSSLCRPMDHISCSSAFTGPTLNCHWYDGGNSGEGFCDVNNARCSWFNADNCVSESQKYDGMKCEVIDDLCSYAAKITIPAVWALFAVLVITLFL